MYAFTSKNYDLHKFVLSTYLLGLNFVVVLLFFSDKYFQLEQIKIVVQVIVCIHRSANIPDKSDFYKLVYANKIPDLNLRGPEDIFLSKEQKVGVPVQRTNLFVRFLFFGPLYLRFWNDDLSKKWTNSNKIINIDIIIIPKYYSYPGKIHYTDLRVSRSMKTIKRLNLIFCKSLLHTQKYI